MALADDLSKFARIANGAFNSISANSTAITALNVGGVAMNANGVASNTFTIGTAAYFVANGNVGIGTSSPAYELDVYASSGDAIAAVRSAASGAGIIRVVGSNTTFAAYNALISTELSGTQQWYMGGDGVANTIIIKNGTSNTAIFAANGNVGIGTASPSSRLHVVGGLVQFEQTGTGNYGGLEIGGPGGAYIDLKSPMTDDFDFRFISDGGGQGVITAGATPLYFSTNATERMRIDGSGNIGIGTSDPSFSGNVSSRFTIVANSTVGTALTLAANSTQLSFAINPATNGSWTMFDRAANGGIGVWTAGITQSNGNIGIATTSPNARLAVNGAVSSTGRYTRSTTGGINSASARFALTTSQQADYHIASSINGAGTSNTQQYGLTFSPAGGSTQAGILFSENGTDGTAIGFFNTNSYAAGPQLRASLDSVGNFNTAGTITQNGTAVVTNNGGSWGISVTGNAATVTNGLYTTGGQTIASRTRFGPYAGSTQQGGGSNVTGIEILNNFGTGDSNAAAISFHCQGAYGMHMHLRPDAYFGIGGWSAAPWRWYVFMGNGDMTAAGNVVAYSDPRLKEEIQKIDSPVEKLKKLNGMRFRWKQNSILGHPGEYDYGVLANEVQEVFPEIVTDTMHDAPEGDRYKAVAYDKLVPVLIEAIKEQQTQIESLLKEVKECKTIIQTLQQQ